METRENREPKRHRDLQGAVSALLESGWSWQPCASGWEDGRALLERKCQSDLSAEGYCQIAVMTNWRADRFSLCCPEHRLQALSVTRNG